MGVLVETGFSDVEIRERFDPFSGTSKERVARKFGVTAVNLHAARPSRARDGQAR